MQQSNAGDDHNVCRELGRICALHAERTALYLPDLGGDARLSYGQLDRAVGAAAAFLAQSGLKYGERLLVCLDTEVHVPLLVFACARLGATAVVVGNRLSQEEMHYVSGDAAPSMIVTSSECLALFDSPPAAGRPTVFVVAEPGEETPGLRLFPSLEALCEKAREVVPIVPVAAEHPVLVLYTSGTTSRPKGVVISHAHLQWAAQNNIRQLGLSERDVTLVFFPLCHTMAFSYQLLSSLFAGAAVVLRRVFNPARFWNDAQRFQCTWAAILPFVCHALAALDVPAQHSFRFWGFPSRNQDVEARFGVRTLGWWGMTELFALGCVTSPAEGADANYSIGKPVSGYPYRMSEVRDDAGPFKARISGALELAGEPGRTLFVGYLNKPRETREAFTEDGWYITGDRFFQNDDQVLFFDVRLKDIIKVGGENVSAAEIEFAAYASAVISEVAVISRPDALLTEIPVLFAVLNAEGRADQALARQRILLACHERLADFKRPREIVFLDDFPRAGLRKVAKGELRQMTLRMASEPA